MSRFITHQRGNPMASQGNSAHGIDPKNKKRDNRSRKKKKMALAAHRPAGRKSRKSKTTRLGVPFFFSVLFYRYDHMSRKSWNCWPSAPQQVVISPVIFLMLPGQKLEQRREPTRRFVCRFLFIEEEEENAAKPKVDGTLPPHKIL